VIVVHSIAELRQLLSRARAHRERIGFVPTMGYLHEGHLTLVDRARTAADVVVMSIFVNPLQFGPGEDLDRYPRDMERDTALAEQRGVSVLFSPDGPEMYPAGAQSTRITAPDLERVLCGRFRPGHFEGVLTVVAKLFNIVEPDVAVFGQKDLQQAVLVRRLVRDLDFDVHIDVAPIVREADGLALSSRNSYLSADGRRSALALRRSLDAAQDAFARGETTPARVIAAARAVLDAAPGVREVQYVDLVDAHTLESPATARAGDAIAIAAFVGRTRLIDNHLLQ
jgi:pantoate--beta-alanine ligase